MITALLKAGLLKPGLFFFMGMGVMSFFLLPVVKKQKDDILMLVKDNKGLGVARKNLARHWNEALDACLEAPENRKELACRLFPDACAAEK